jgi:hypothetical protein
MQICAGLTSAAYLREHNCESVLRTRQIVPGTAWVVEVLQVTNRYASEGSKSAVRRLHTVRRTKLKWKNSREGQKKDRYTGKEKTRERI